MKLARINTLLLVAIILINGYIVVLPVLPGVLYKVSGHSNAQAASLEQKIQTLSTTKAQDGSVAKENRLIIPRIGLDQQIFEGKTAKTLNSGLWHRPFTSNPDKGGNMVMAGHRLTYTNPQGTLYHLDKVAAGDTVAVWWSGRMHTYTVRETKVVPANEVSIENDTLTPQLTIYTCTPLWLPKDRLVVIATPNEGQ